MHPHVAAGLFGGLVLALGAASFLIWAAIFRKWSSGGAILPFLPRRPVPWGPVGLVVAGIIFFLSAASALLAPEDTPDPSPALSVQLFLQDAVLKLVIAGGVTAWLMMSRRATREDLGLPANLPEAASDSLLGVLSSVAALVPVYTILLVLVQTFGDRPQNPLIEDLLEEPSGPMIATAFLSAVIVAPIFEEFIFRLLIQGWLERIFMPRRAFTHPAAPLESPAAETEAAADGSEGSDEQWQEVPPDGEATSPGEPVDRAEDVRVVWLPILASSLLFAAAHFGFEYGYSPVPLFLLAVIFGYVYQRTHRILPCIIAHLVFNASSLIMLWLQLAAGPQDNP